MPNRPYPLRMPEGVLQAAEMRGQEERTDKTTVLRSTCPYWDETSVRTSLTESRHNASVPRKGEPGTEQECCSHVKHGIGVQRHVWSWVRYHTISGSSTGFPCTSNCPWVERAVLPPACPTPPFPSRLPASPLAVLPSPVPTAPGPGMGAYAASTQVRGCTHRSAFQA